MTTVEHAPAGLVPDWTVGDRMRKAREHAKLNQSDLAGIIEIARSSIVNYETDRKMVPRPVLIAWSLATGVPYEWLCHGDTEPCGPSYSRSELSSVSDTDRSITMQCLQSVADAS